MFFYFYFVYFSFMLYAYITQCCIYYSCQFITIRKFHTVLAAMEVINDKIVRSNGNIRTTCTSSAKFWIILDIFLYLLFGGLELTYFLSIGKSRFALNGILITAVIMMDIHISMLYLLTASQINLYYEYLNNKLNASVCLLIKEVNALEKFGKNIQFLFQILILID